MSRKLASRAVLLAVSVSVLFLAGLSIWISLRSHAGHGVDRELRRIVDFGNLWFPAGCEDVLVYEQSSLVHGIENMEAHARLPKRQVSKFIAENGLVRGYPPLRFVNERVRFDDADERILSFLASKEQLPLGLQHVEDLDRVYQLDRPAKGKRLWGCILILDSSTGSVWLRLMCPEPR